MRKDCFKNFAFVVLCLMVSFNVVLAESQSGSKEREFKVVGPPERVKVTTAAGVFEFDCFCPVVTLNRNL
jgi:hypothetical protein